MKYLLDLDMDKCISCGACVAGCPTSALRMIPWEDVAKAL